MKLNDRSNILYGKKLVVCGDSFTEGDFTGFVDENGLKEKESPLVFDVKRQMYKTYPWWIAERNDMILINEAKCGSIMALSKEYLDDTQNVDINVRQPFALERYKRIPLDTDYLLIQFGLNDMFHCNLGTISDETNDTFYGAFNIVLEYFLENLPFTKIGTVISNAYLDNKFRVAIIEVSKKWGIPYLDLLDDGSVPATLKKTGMCEKAIELRNKTFFVSEENRHPNVKAHEFISSIYEAFLRRI